MTRRASAVPRGGPGSGLAVLTLTLTLAATLTPRAQPSFLASDVERWRPEIHFTPPRHFMNDPNGLVYFDGEYHLFYQHNPFGPKWGHMSWGHAVSPDLLHWTDLPLALREQDGWMAFSGGAVVDASNTSGLCRTGTPCLVAAYTLHRRGRQAQGIAVSQDRGRTWTPFDRNPVLDLGLEDFRDPNVFWHEPTRRWVMAAVVPGARQVRFFGSKDLKAWSPLGSFGPAGATEGIWECPALMRVPVEGRPGTLAWVLAVSVNQGAPAGGTGVQYFVGDFDGSRFTVPVPSATAWADYGPDFYAAQHFSHLPDADRRAVWLAWMNNWEYANEVPTGEGGIESEADDARWGIALSAPETPGPWRGAMTIPRELAVRRTPAGDVLVQHPIAALEDLRTSRPPTFHLPQPGDKGSLVFGRTRPPSLVPLDLDVEIRFHKSTRAGLRIEWGRGEYVEVMLDRTDRRIVLDRTHVGEELAPRGFARTAAAPFDGGDRARLRVIVDRSSLEVFAGDGATVLTMTVYPTDPSVRRVRTASDGRGARVSVNESVLRPAIGR